MAKWFSARFLLAGFILLLAILLTVIVVGNLRQEVRESVIESIVKDADLAMRSINYTETRDGVRKWSLQADAAEHHMQAAKTRVANVRMTVFDAERGNMTLTADHGDLDLEKQTVYLQGNVRVRSEDGALLISDDLTFDDEAKVVSTDGPVRMVSAELEISGTGMRYSLTDYELKLFADVDARIAGALKTP